MPTWTIDLSSLTQLTSAARLVPYRAVTTTDRAAVRLYEWNSRVSAAMWETLGHLEIVVRNAMDRELTAWSTASHDEPRWYHDPGRQLTTRHQNDVAKALRRATAARPELHGRVVAELTFGFWRYLTASHYDRTLWRFCLYKAFSHQPRRAVHDALAPLHLLRNRIGHHEPIHHMPLAQRHATLLEVAGWVDPDARRWIAARSRVARALRERPRPS